MTRRSAIVAVGVVAAVALAGGGGWWAAETFQSPAQREAAAAAPSPGAVTVPVVTQALEETASARGTVRQLTGEQVALAAGDGTTVVTQEVVPAGAEITAGQVLTELNGRPVIALPGRFLYYRDLALGDSGPDVAQLQSALVAAGFALRSDGEFGSATERAVRALYRRIGYPVPEEEVEVQVGSTPTDTASGTDPDASEAQTPTAAPTTTTARRLLLPAAELTAISTLPATLTSVPGVGTVVGGDGATIVLASGELVAEAEVAASLAARIVQETPVSVDRGDGQQVACRIVALPVAKEDETTVLVRLRPEEGFAADWLAAEVLAVFVLQEVSEPALVVPTGAVVPGGHDTSQVLVQQADGSFRAVGVTELGTLGGRTAVAPVEPGALAEGDQVKVA